MRVNELVRGKRGVTADTALRLAQLFKTTPQFWMHMQANYDLKVAMARRKALNEPSANPSAMGLLSRYFGAPCRGERRAMPDGIAGICGDVVDPTGPASRFRLAFAYGPLEDLRLSGRTVPVPPGG